MNRGGAILPTMRKLIALFSPHCADRGTLDALHVMIADRGQWLKAHGLFDQIRYKNVKAGRANDKLLQAQYTFEEMCAKTLYDLSGASTPFDPDSPFWVIPSAIELARELNIDEAEVLRAFAV